MRVHNTAIISANPLIVQGLSHYINLVAADPEIEIFGQLPVFSWLSRNDYFAVFLDLPLVPDPITYSIEKMYENRKDSKLILVSENEPQRRIQPYFDTFLSSHDSEEEVLRKLQAVYQPENQRQLKRIANGILTEREIEVLRFVALGYTNKVISDELSISAHTVITHRKNITAKLGIKTIAGLTVYSVLNGIIAAE
jgi:DNA-binding NarL/FixJ family response regulator